MRLLQSPKLTKKQLKDPSGLDPKIKDIIKKFRAAYKATRSKSIDSLLLYANVPAYEREFIINNFKNLLLVMEDEERKDLQKYFGWALIFAWLNYRKWMDIYDQGMQEERQEVTGFTRYFKPPIKPEMPRTDQELMKIFNERMNSLLADVRQELLDGIKTDLDLARLHNWDSKKTKEVLDKRFTKAENRSVSIARTETMFVYNSFIENRARKDGVENLIWITANDELVCTVCGLNHLKAFPINNLPDLPAHTHCRCSWMIPMTRD